MLRPIAAAAALALWPFANPPAASSQDSRAATLEQQRAAKAAQVQPYQPGKIEKALLYVEREDPLRKISPYNGFFVQYGYTGRPVGAGIGASAGYRHDLFDRRARVLVEGGATLRGYRMVRGDFSLPYLARDRVELGLEAGDWHNPQEDFFGLGPGSLEADRVNFLYDRRDVQGRAILKPVRSFQTGVRYGRLNTSIGSGTDKRYPSLEQRFGDPEAPGVTDQPDFSYTDLFATADNRDQPGNPRAGGYYGLMWRRHSDRDFDKYSFRLFQADLQQFFPIFDKKRVFAVRGRVMTTAAGAGQTVPFYLRPTLGGSDSLRSVADYRFRDNNTLSINVEYRWEAFSGLDMALFTDWGKVTARAADLDFGDLQRAYGIGFRFNTYKAVFLRIDLAIAGPEAPRLFFKYSKAF
jgi:outer membrane protein assembly factor BamA